VALALLASAQLMLVLDATVVNVALPVIGPALHLQRTEVPWVMTIYTMFFGGLMLLGGRIADLFGTRRLTLAGLATVLTLFQGAGRGKALGLRSALVNTFHELGGAAGVAVLSSATGAGLVAAGVAGQAFSHAFTVGAICAAASVVIAAALVPAVLRKPPAARG
jgi:MFS family permease